MALRLAIKALPYATLVAVVDVIILRRQFDAPVLAAAISLIVGAGAVCLVLVRRADECADSNRVRWATSWLLAFQLGALVLLPALIAATRALRDDQIPGWLFGFVNKRWLIAAYNVIVVTIVLFPVAIHRLQGHIVEDMATGGAIQPTPAWRRWTIRAAGATLVTALTLYFAGPPWHLNRHHRPIDWHEQAHLGPLQAIAKGHLPFIGPASTQYGPGAQVMMYGVMRAVGRFDIPAFRTAWAVFQAIGLFIVAGLAYCWIGLFGVLAVVPLALGYSPLAFYGSLPDGTFGGYFGWANPLRYAGTLVAVPALAALVSDDPATAPRFDWRAIGLGAVWALSAWVAQENLSTTIAAGGLTLLVLWSTRTTTAPRILRVIRDVALGFACVAVVVLGYYAWHGALGAFASNYFLVPRAVAAGYSNMWWADVTSFHRRTYYLAIPFLLAIAVCTIWRVPTMSVEPLDFRRRRMLSFVCVQLACIQTALLRSDAEHLIGTLAALPFILVLGLVDLPRFVADTWPRRVVVGAAFLATVLAVFPAILVIPWNQLLLTPAAKFQPDNDALSVPMKYGSRVGFRRATRWLADEPTLAVGSGLSMHEFLDFASDLHDLVGERKTYVASVSSGCTMTSRGDCVWAGAVLFMADLTPASYPLDRDTMTFNDALRRVASEHIREHPREYDCVIVSSLRAIEAQAFMAGHPDATVVERQLGAHRAYVLMSRDGRP
jgi:hypothetical protein